MLDATAASRRGNKLLQQAVAAARACVDLVTAHDVQLLSDACDSQLLQRLLTEGCGAVEGQDVGLEGALPEGVAALVSVFECQLQAPDGSNAAMVAPAPGTSPAYDRAAERVRSAQQELEAYVDEQRQRHAIPELHAKEVGRPGRKTTVMEVSVRVCVEAIRASPSLVCRLGHACSMLC